MRSLLAAIVLVVGLPATHAEERAWDFRVLLEGREIGRHRFTLEAAGEKIDMRSEARFDVRVLLVSVYRYRQVVAEQWDGNCLQSLDSRTETNGEREIVSAAARDARFVVERRGGKDEHEGCVMSFAYWNPRILEARSLLNSQTGKLLPVTVTTQGKETIEVRGERLAARRHRISGPQLQIDLWYVGEHWVALEALAQGGRRLRYELM
jgi:hypothetical protein